MAKPRPPKMATDSEPKAGRFHSPFAALADLRGRLPEADHLEHRGAEPATTAEPLPGKVVVRRERKGRAGKTVTRVSGLGAVTADWTRRMKQELGCGGSVEDGDAILAGDLVDRAATWLEAAGIRQVVRGT